MINKEFIRDQMKYAGITINKLKNITGIGYATLNDYLNKKDYDIKAKNYDLIVNTLLTPYEQLLYANVQLNSLNSKTNHFYLFNELKCRKVFANIKSDSIAIKSSYSDSKNSLPKHVEIIFKDEEGNNKIREFNEELYNKIINKSDSNKISLIKEYFEVLNDEKINRIGTYYVNLKNQNGKFILNYIFFNKYKCKNSYEYNFELEYRSKELTYNELNLSPDELKRVINDNYEKVNNIEKKYFSDESKAKEEAEKSGGVLFIEKIIDRNK